MAKPSKAKPSAKAKVDDEATSKARKTAVLRSLDALARQVEAHWEKARVADGKAQEHRLSVCCYLASAQGQAKAAGIPFNKWAKDHLSFNPDVARKMASIGAKPESERVKALEDWRERDRRANVTYRARQQELKEAGKAALASAPAPAPAPAPALAPTSAGRTISKASDMTPLQAPKQPASASVLEAFQKLPILERRPVLASMIDAAGGIAAVVALLPRGEQDTLCRSLAGRLGYNLAEPALVVASSPPANGDGLDIPDFLKRPALAAAKSAAKPVVGKPEATLGEVLAAAKPTVTKPVVGKAKRGKRA